MNYKTKYLKYKTKYLNMQGGAIEFGCTSKEKPHMCSNSTVNFGLCVDNIETCNNPEYISTDVELPTLIDLNINDEEREELELLKEIGIAKGYIEDHLSKSCYTQSNEPTIYENNFKIPNNEFSIITLNVMGIYIDGKEDSAAVLNLMGKRIEMLQKEILQLKPDIMCFQEMSLTSFNLLYTKEISDIYKYYYEENFKNIDLKSDRERDVEVFVISKYPIKKVTMYRLEGNIKHNNSLAVYDFGNLIVFNLHLQPGSKNSPGQKYKADNYARCRIHEILFIKSLIDKIQKDTPRPVILLGDFNFDLNGPIQDWPENGHLNKLGFKDSWIESNPTLLPSDGNTEETDINTMRWNNKFEEKHYRYDAILYNDFLTSMESRVICNKPFLIIKDPILYENYRKAILSKDSSKHKQIRKSHGNYELFISDHFGIFTKFKFND
jgi:exonuclease III